MSQIPKVIVFGELLLRLDTPGQQRFAQAQALNLSFTGGEANVAVALAQWGQRSSIVSVVPAHDLGTACLNHLQRYSVHTDSILRNAERLGLLYVESGAGQRGTNVIYDRNETGFRKLGLGDVDWNQVLMGPQSLHVTGTALVSPGTRELLLAGLRIAKERGVQVSFDVSYRSQLWSLSTAQQAYLEVIPFVDLFLGSEQDAATFFDISETGDAAVVSLAKKYDLSGVAFTDRSIDESGTNFYSALFYDGQEFFKSPRYPTVSVDRIGTGDAFAAGMIYGKLTAMSASDRLNFATAAAVLKHTIPGDFALLKVSEIGSFLAGQTIGKIVR